MLVADGWDECILGFTYVDGRPRTVYLRDRMIAQMMEKGDCSYEDADEFISFNVEGAMVGLEAPPLLVTRATREDLDLVADLAEEEVSQT